MSEALLSIENVALRQIITKRDAEIARLRGAIEGDQDVWDIVDGKNSEIARLRAAFEAQLEAHNYAEVLKIARKALANKEGEIKGDTHVLG